MCRRLTPQTVPRTGHPRLTALQCQQRGGSGRPTACSPAGPSSAPRPSHPAEQTTQRLTTPEADNKGGPVAVQELRSLMLKPVM